MGKLDASNIKVCFFDIDGTSYVNQIKSCNELDLYAMKKLKEKGVKLFINTSRTPEECVNVPLNLVELMDGIVCGGGSHIRYHDEVIYTKTIDQEDASRVISYLEENKYTYRWSSVDGQGHFGSIHPTKIEELFQFLYGMCPTPKPYENQPLINILFYTSEKSEYLKVASLAPNSHALTLKSANEITAENTNKGSAVAKVCELLGLDISQSIAFGDSYNDESMIIQAGIGVAMGNAHDEVKAYADYIAKSNVECGIYHTFVDLKMIEEKDA